MSNEFLEKMLEAGEKYSARPEFVNVAKMKLSLGYSAKVKGQRPANFFKPYGHPDDAKRVAAEVNDRLKNDSLKNKAENAIMLSIPQETNMSEKVTWDIQQITFADFSEKTTEEDSEYKALIMVLKDGDFPIGEWFWGSYKNVEFGEYVNSQGETKKNYLVLPVERYADEATARAAVGGGSGQAQADSNSKWSDTLKANYPDPSLFEKNTSDIQAAWEKIIAGELPWTGAAELPKPPTPPNLKQYLADLYSCESQDIDVALNETPF